MEIHGIARRMWDEGEKKLPGRVRVMRDEGKWRHPGEYGECEKKEEAAMWGRSVPTGPRKAGCVVEELSHQTDHTGHRTVQGSELIRQITQNTELSRCRNSSDRSHRTPYCPVLTVLYQCPTSSDRSHWPRTVLVSDLIRQITLTPYCPSVRPHQTDHVDPVLSQCPTSSDRSRWPRTVPMSDLRQICLHIISLWHNSHDVFYTFHPPFLVAQLVWRILGLPNPFLKCQNSYSGFSSSSHFEWRIFRLPHLFLTAHFEWRIFRLPTFFLTAHFEWRIFRLPTFS